MTLKVTQPDRDLLHNLAPRARGITEEYIGEYGFVVALTGDGRIRVVWDEGGWNDCLPDEIEVTFK